MGDGSSRLAYNPGWLEAATVNLMTIRPDVWTICVYRPDVVECTGRVVYTCVETGPCDWCGRMLDTAALLALRLLGNDGWVGVPCRKRILRRMLLTCVRSVVPGSGTLRQRELYRFTPYVCSYSIIFPHYEHLTRSAKWTLFGFDFDCFSFHIRIALTCTDTDSFLLQHVS